MKRVEQILDMSRKLTGNTRYDSDSGIPQEVFVQFLNNAQDSLTKEVVNLKTKYLKKTSTVTVVSGQATYSYPSDCYMQHVDTIQWVQSLTDAPINLQKCSTKEKLSTQVGYPFGYILENDGYHLNPPLNNGYLMVTYSKELPRLQKKCGQIASLTLVGQTLSALTVATTGTYDTTAINDDYYLCVVDKYGTQKASNIVYASETAGTFTLSSQTLATGETMAVGDFITVGANTTNLPAWPNVCESYLLKHMSYDVKFMDASSWTKEAKEDMSQFFASLSGSFATLSDDIIDIPITNTDLL